MGPGPNERALLLAVQKSRLNFLLPKCEMQEILIEILTASHQFYPAVVHFHLCSLWQKLHPHKLLTGSGIWFRR
jgi:hypothetical protein